MNVMGKIFVIANLVFSVLTAGLIMFVYAARTGWSERYTRLENQAKVAQQNAITYQELADKAKADQNDAVAKVRADLDKMTKERDKFKGESENYQAQLKTQTGELEKAATNAKAQAEHNKRLQGESDNYKSLLASANKQIGDLEKDKSTLRNRAVEAEIAADAQKERNQNLLKDNEQLTKDLQKAQALAASGGKPSAGRAAVNPPLEDLHGRIERSDADGFVEVSIGSNQGLQVGNTLEVFRTTPEPKYLGTIQILNVRADRAVGKPLSRPAAPIKAGDTVASRIQ